MKKINITEYAMLIALVILSVAFALASDVFLSPGNIINVLRQISIMGILSVGTTMVMITGGIDLSVGSVVGVSSVVVAVLISSGISPILAIIAALIIGALIGLLNGFLITDIGMFPMIATLATMTIFRGVAYLITGGLPVHGFPDSFLFLGQGYLFGIPFPVIIMALIFILGYIILNHTVFGRRIYGIGGNIEASRLSGIPVKRTLYNVYILQGILAAGAGVILLSRINSGQPTSGAGYEMDVITATVLGGTSVSGGVGNIRGVIIGVLFMGILTNGMVLLNVQDYWQQVIRGGVLILAVAFDLYTIKKSK